ncbi:unnamed protein product, partial [Dibothriocephalus latus]
SLDTLTSGASVSAVVATNSTPPTSDHPKLKSPQPTVAGKLSDSEVTTNHQPKGGPLPSVPSRVLPEAPAAQQQTQTQKPKPAIIFNSRVLACNKPLLNGTSTTPAAANGVRPDEIPKAVRIAVVPKAVPSSLHRSSSIPAVQTVWSSSQRFSHCNYYQWRIITLTNPAQSSFIPKGESKNADLGHTLLVYGERNLVSSSSVLVLSFRYHNISPLLLS